MDNKRVAQLLLEGAYHSSLRAAELVKHAEAALNIAKKIEYEAATRLDRLRTQRGTEPW